MLGQILLRHPATVAYAFRPCIVAGPNAQTLVDELPYVRLSESMPDAVRSLLSSMPILKPVIPDPGTPLPARARGRRGVGLPRGRAGQGRARPVQPRRRGERSR